MSDETLTQRFDHVFIVTYGRTGSTLLMNILNGIDGYFIRGESDGLIAPLVRALDICDGMNARVARQNSNRPASPYFQAEIIDYPVVRQFLFDAIDTLVRAVPEQGKFRVSGFKETNWPGAGLPELLDFLSKSFPRVGYVFLTRRHDEVIDSGFFLNIGEAKARRQLIEADRRYARYARKHPLNSFQIAYADLEPDNQRLKRLFAFLGETYDPEKISEICAQSYSYNIPEDEAKRMRRNTQRRVGRFLRK